MLMESVKYLVIGAGLAGHKAAVGIRNHEQQSSIMLVGSEPHRPYNRPPLTKEYMQGKALPEQAFLDRPGFYHENNIELLLGTTVTALDASARTATLSEGRVVKFEKALLATGGTPVKLDLPGSRLSNVFYLRTLDEAVAVSNYAKPGMRVAIIGGGFIGIELAASFSQRDLHATVIDPGLHIWSRFAGRELADFIQSQCSHKGVAFLNGETAAQITDGDAKFVITQSGKKVPCNMVVIAVGIVPDVELAKQAGLAIDNGVVVNEFLQTSHPDIYAAGDICNYPDPFFNRRRRVEHWGQADYTGQLAGENMAGLQKPYDLLTYIFSDIFDMHIEFAGDENDCDRTIIRGSMEEKSFTVLYIKKDIITAHFSVNLKRKQYSPLQKLIEQKVNIAGREAELADPAFDPSNLLALHVK